MSLRLLGTVVKGKSDERIYRAIQLANKIECLLIHDKDAEKSAASLSVEAGSLLDPRQTQGLAHYLEHMLFMGTEKYPNQNEYSEFLAKHSGGSNAYTAQNETNYHFEVASPALNDTLDRFAQFFIAPLMNEGSSQRQMNAVHSQHSKNLLNDAWRKYQLWKSSAKTGHPLNKFSTGDKTTLNVPNVRKHLLDFYEKQYSANLMKLVVYSKQNVQTLAEVVQQKFGSIINKELPAFQLTDFPFEESNLGNIYKIVPVKNRQSVEYVWIVSNQEPHYRNCPGRYIGHLIGHEGPGSLLSLLIKEGLAEELSAGSSNEFKLYTQFTVNITLTEKGFHNLNKITGYLFYYIEMLKKEGPQKWIFEELQKINKLEFDNYDKRQGMNFVSSLAKRMQTTAVEEVLVKDYLMESWQPELITNYLNEMTVSRLRMTVMSPKYAETCTLEEPIYKTKYSVEPIPKEIVSIPCTVSLPPPNIYFPENMDVLTPAETTTPVEIECSEYLHLFHKQDHQFRLPKATIKLRVYFKLPYDPKKILVKSIYFAMLKNYLREITYMGERAHVDSTISSLTHAFEIDISGFNDGLNKYVPNYLEELLNYNPNDLSSFEVLKARNKREYENFFKQNPYEQAYQYHLEALRDIGEVDPSLRRVLIDSIEFQDVVNFAKEWREKVFAEMYVSGNVTKEKAQEFAENVEAKLKKFSPLPKDQVGSIRGVNLKEGQVWMIEKVAENELEPNSAIIFHYQYEEFGVVTKLLQDLCMSFIKEPAFDYLRTKEQLGYIVKCLPDDHRGVLGISVLVQSNVKCSHELRIYIDRLMDILKDKIETLTEAEFEEYKKSLLSVKLQKDKNLAHQTVRFWADIVKHIYNFNRKEEEIATIPKITLQEFKDFFKRVFLTNPKCFETHVSSKAHEEQNNVFRKQRMEANPALRLAPSIEWFKKKMPLHPDYFAML